MIPSFPTRIQPTPARRFERPSHEPAHSWAKVPEHVHPAPSSSRCPPGGASFISATWLTGRRHRLAKAGLRSRPLTPGPAAPEDRVEITAPEGVRLPMHPAAPLPDRPLPPPDEDVGGRTASRPPASAPGRPLPPPDEDAPTMVAVSGGVDSAVALMRLVEAGVPVQAMFMKSWEEDDRDGHCPAAEDLADAQRVCDRLGVPLHAVNCSDAYWDNVFVRFIRGLERGMTPNPDVMCNREVKFTAFVEHARRLGAERVATGHYARIDRTGGGVRLLRGADPAKDQSYFLHALDRSQLDRAVFPLGGLRKHAVRAMARRAGLAPHDKPDSTGICFVGERRFPSFLARFVDAAPGPVETGGRDPHRRASGARVLHHRPAPGPGDRRPQGRRAGALVRRGEGPCAQRPRRRPGTRPPRAAHAPAAGARRALDRGPRPAAAAAVRGEDSIPAGGSGVHRPARRTRGGRPRPPLRAGATGGGPRPVRGALRRRRMPRRRRDRARRPGVAGGRAGTGPKLDVELTRDRARRLPRPGGGIEGGPQDWHGAIRRFRTDGVVAN